MGDPVQDDQRERVTSGQAWAEFCDRIKDAGQLVLERSSSELDRTEGFRFLSRLVRGGLESFVESGDARFPLIRTLPDQVKIGSDNPDAIYQTATIDGRFRYRLSGTRGTVHYLSLSAFAGNYGAAQDRLGVMGFLDGKDLVVDDDGRFEVILSGSREGENWIEMRPEPGTLAIRQFFLDRDNEIPARMRIECLDTKEALPPLTPERFGRSLNGAGAFVAGCSTLFTNWVDELAANTKNSFTTDAPAAQGAWGDPNQIFHHGYYAFEDDEALLIEFTPPDCFYWNFQIDNRWMESLDYRWLPVTINKHSAHYEPDGSVRLVIAHRDPGIPNWMDTAGHRHGAMGLRWNQAKEDVEPRVRVVPISELR
jgi:hypothetical protein